MRKYYLTISITLSLVSPGCAGLPFMEFRTAEERMADRWEEIREAQAELEALRQQRVQQGLTEREIVLGMEMQHVRSVWGNPMNVESAGSGGNQRWVYFEGLSSRWSASQARVLYFENGRVVGWETQ